MSMNTVDQFRRHVKRTFLIIHVSAGRTKRDLQRKGTNVNYPLSKASGIAVALFQSQFDEDEVHKGYAHNNQ